MALVIVSGLASSGRTTRSLELKADLEQRISSTSAATSGSSSARGINRVVIVSDADIHVPRTAYSSQRTEKPARASYLSAVTRALGRDTVVIADGGAGLNIKGFRYQLWCAAREVGVRCLSILVHTHPDVCRSWNQQRRAGDQHATHEAAYDDETLDSLLARFEEPNPMTRWDSPLFIVPTTLEAATPNSDPEITANDVDKTRIRSEPIPLDEIWTAITTGSVSKAPEVVAPTRSTTANYLSLLESSTSLCVEQILSHHTSFGLQAGDQISVTHASLQGPSPLTFTLSADRGDTKPTLPALQRIRRQFVRMHSSGASNINQLGSAARQEGVHFSLTPAAKLDQADKRQAAAAAAAPAPVESASPEWSIAKRFLAFLEGAL
ncbi:chromatin associated protein KTI12 [Testicularia cyperi]|uniref:Chromatin associated protein KTI12 n=1 Tax=Testicularia cyperi TaxID=1882483 RepID=A0A317XXX7_9BASI|nr:chromatin associated protein KTI12 [Testicularia cyperi]